MGLIVRLNKTMSPDDQGKLFEWLFEEFGSPGVGRWRLVSLSAIKFKDPDDGVYFKLVWNHL